MGDVFFSGFGNVLFVIVWWSTVAGWYYTDHYKSKKDNKQYWIDLWHRQMQALLNQQED